MAVSGLLDVLERLQHFGNEVLTNLDQAGMLRLLLRADELAVRALKIALDGVVLEVVDGLGLVLHVVVAGRRGRRGGRRRLREHGSRRSRQGEPSEEGETDDEFLILHVRFSFWEARLLGVRQPKPRLVPRKPIFFVACSGFTPRQATVLTISCPGTYFFFLPPFLPPAAGLSPALSSPPGAPSVAPAAAGLAALSAAALSPAALSEAAFSLAAFSAA